MTMIYNIIASIIGKSLDDKVKRLFTLSDKEILWHENQDCSYCRQQISSINDAKVENIYHFNKVGNTELSNEQLFHKHCDRKKNAIESIIDFEDKE